MLPASADGERFHSDSESLEILHDRLVGSSAQLICGECSALPRTGTNHILQSCTPPQSGLSLTPARLRLVTWHKSRCSPSVAASETLAHLPHETWNRSVGIPGKRISRAMFSDLQGRFRGSETEVR